MARQSAEARAAAGLRTAGRPPRAPRNLGEAERAVWRETVAYFAPDHFRGSRALLLTYCELMVMIRATAAQLEVYPVGGAREKWKLRRLHLQRVRAAESLAKALRLTPSSRLRPDAGALAEKPPRRSPFLAAGLEARPRSAGDALFLGPSLPVPALATADDDGGSPPPDLPGAEP